MFPHTGQAGIPSVANKWIVLKFGGTSVAGKPQWDVIAELMQARREAGYRVLLVCSAVAGVTNALGALAGQPNSTRRLQAVLQTHRRLGAELGVDERLWLPRANALFDQRLQDLLHDPGPRNQAALLALGEWLSTRIGSHFLSRQTAVDWVDARDALEAVPEKDLSPARRWLSAACAAGEDPGLESRWSGLAPVLLTQGFVARTDAGDTVLLGRGGSDTSAALLAGRLAAERLEIWTDVPGLFSADPRRIAEARLLTAVDYDEALEMAASGARVVHPRCIRAAAATRLPIVIRDMNHRGVSGTRIGQGLAVSEGIKTVTCQMNMAVILLQNLDARFQVGFLAEVFDIFRRRGVSVDLVATSETTTTVAVNCEDNHLGRDELAGLADELAGRCRVDLYPDCVCVNLVGRGVRTALSRLQDVMRHFDQRPLLMVSQSANDLCLSLLVRAGDQEPLLQEAHRALIPAEDHGSGGVFGPRWDQIG
jgi:diaminopimelate decarboxylase/aspartate kinase